LNGLDDISITLQNETHIAAYEAKRPSHKPRTLPV
ncbi:3-isopropylmalate dehydratase small subunit, partial [Streptomyces sp. NPDC006368]